MVDGSGLQAAKAAFAIAARNVVDVSTRDYYQRALARKQLWELPLPNKSDGVAQEELCQGGCYVEYVSAWNTGRPQVVMSMPTGIPRLPVATLSIQMHALLAPVLPPGFEFAVVDSEGVVQFHSDWQRNGQENLLLETDQNSRLRSLVASRSAGTFTTMYWGYPYRGYVRARPYSRLVDRRVPLQAAGARACGRVVHGSDAARGTVHVRMGRGDAAVAAARGVMVVAGSAAPALVCAARMPGGRRHGAMAGIAWLVSPSDVTAIAGITIPILTWAVVYIVLAVRPAGAGEVKQWTEMCRSYRFAGTALFLLTAAVPAASFYALSFDRHIEAFVKERQIALAASHQRGRGVQTTGTQVRPTSTSCATTTRTTTVRSRALRTRATCRGARRLAAICMRHSRTPIPYFTSASVALRELMHEKSDDDSWSSHRNDAPETGAPTPIRETPSSWVQVTTALPATDRLAWNRARTRTSSWSPSSRS